MRTVYPVRADVPGLELPLKVRLAEDVLGTLEQGDGGLRLIVDRRVDRDALEFVTHSGLFREHPNGSREELPALQLRGNDRPDWVLAVDLVSAISFLSDVPLRVSVRIGDDRFVAEDEGDREILADFGTHHVYHRTGGRLGTRTFGRVALTAEHLSTLLGRRAGLRIYADALKLGTSTARFRELWRVLESAFNRQDDELVGLLADYPPAQAMAFSRAELKRLLVLRNRAGHAASKAGVKQLLAVERECSQSLTRLKNLAERVILTKHSWGYPSKGSRSSCHCRPSSGLRSRRVSATFFEAARAVRLRPRGAKRPRCHPRGRWPV
jgi:hypothetical protein